jgi:hypothetical protein
MNELADETLNEVIEESVDEQVEVDEETEESPEQSDTDQGEITEESESEEAEESEDDEVIVQIGEDAPPTEEESSPAPEWVKEVRKTNRELQRKNKELEAQLNNQVTESNPVPQEMEKPTLDALAYDVNAYEQKLGEYYEHKKAMDEHQAAQQQQYQQAEQVWQSKLEGYAQKRSELKVRDFESAEHLIESTLNNNQQGILLEGADNPALLVYALGKNPKKAKELAAIDNPVSFAFAVAKLETQLKVSNRKAKAQPEKNFKSSTKSSGAVDSTLERLREEAAKTGNMDKVMQYKRNLKRATK